MEFDDFVETSDVEELQELEEEGGRRALSSSHQRHDSFSPRKRVKLYHGSLNDDEHLRPLFSPELHSPPKSTPEALEAPEVIQEQLLDGSRYPLRRRNAAQLKPYTVDQFLYKQALQANPDAIVKFKHLALRNDHYHREDYCDEDGETQEDAYIHSPFYSPLHSAKENIPNSPRPATPIDLDFSDESYPQSKQSKQSDSSFMEIPLPRSKQRALARMLPKSMAFALLKQAASPSTSKNHRRSSTSPASGSDDDEGPLLPGHTRTSKTTNVKDKVIKGDSESEQEIEDDLDTTSFASQSKSRRLSVSDSSSVSDEVEFVHSVRHRRKARNFLVSHSGTSTKKQERINPGDLGIPLLHSGKSFGPSTSIRKEWLYEVIGLITFSQEPVLPPSANSCGFELEPTMGANKLATILQDICATLFEFVTDLPEVDSEATIKGGVIMRVVPQLISWFRKTESEDVFASLRKAGEREIALLVGKIQNLTLPFVDIPILATCWFTVETCARLGCRLEGQPPTGILKESAITLIHLLLQVGLEKPITVVKSDADMTESSVAHFAAELWVSLIHLLGECDSLEKANKRMHPFWMLLMTAIQSPTEGQKPRTNLEASETIWYTIFSVCALSQFSAHGMTTGMPRLPACWDLVVFALKKTRLSEDPKTDLGLPPAMLLQRDKYFGLVMTRCFHLRERWRWKLDDASGLFNTLANIFRSRKFVNLRHEGTGYPKFFKDRNWDLLASYDPKDTAFVLFVKLIVQAVKDDQGGIPGKLSLKAKKLLSLAMPVGSLPFSKTNPPTPHELTMFYNRLSAVAVAVYLEPDEYDSRTRQASGYIKFADADDTARSAVIGGMMNLAIMMVNRKIKMDAITTWIGDMAQVLSVELKETNFHVTVRRGSIILLSCVLLGAVRHILTAYIGLGLYPEPSLLSSLRPVMHSLSNKEDDSKAQGELGLLAESFFSARSAAMPPPGRPVRVPAQVVDEESQDYGALDIDINWSSVDIPEALAFDNEEKLSSSNASHDKALLSVLTSLGFRWIMYRCLKPYLAPPPPSVSFQIYAEQCDMWLRCAVGCTCMEVGDHKWDFWFKVLDPHVTQVDDRWVRRVKLSLMLNILRADPMAYLTYTDRFIDVYLHALGSDSTILEKDYVPFLLSIDNLQHPLLHAAQCLPERNQESGDYEFTVEQFLKLRLPLWRVVFSNLDCLMREQQAGNIALSINNNQYLAKCREVFSVMRSTRASLEGAEHYLNYNDFCISVFQSLKDYPTLRMTENMSFWIDLGRVNN